MSFVKVKYYSNNTNNNRSRNTVIYANGIILIESRL